jgi:hypothetical protein
VAQGETEAQFNNLDTAKQLDSSPECQSQDQGWNLESTQLFAATKSREKHSTRETRFNSILVNVSTDQTIPWWKKAGDNSTSSTTQPWPELGSEHLSHGYADAQHAQGSISRHIGILASGDQRLMRKGEIAAGEGLRSGVLRIV